jgi:predicted permease
MGQATEELLIPFLGALQASVAVLLTIFVGVIASQFQLIGVDSSKEISKVAVRLFLPALLIVNVGSQLHSDTVCIMNTFIIACPQSHRTSLDQHECTAT